MLIVAQCSAVLCDRDNYKQLPGPAADKMNASIISKIHYQELAFSYLQSAGIESIHCENEPYYLVPDDFKEACNTTSDQHAGLFSFFQQHGYIDDKGLPKTIGPFEPAKGVNKTILMEALAAVGLPGDKTHANLIDGVIRDAYAGHDPSLRCWPQQSAFIKKVLGLA